MPQDPTLPLEPSDRVALVDDWFQPRDGLAALRDLEPFAGLHAT